MTFSLNAYAYHTIYGHGTYRTRPRLSSNGLLPTHRIRHGTYLPDKGEVRLSGLEGVEQLEKALLGGNHHGHAQHERADDALIVRVEHDQLLHLRNLVGCRVGKSKYACGGVDVSCFKERATPGQRRSTTSPSFYKWLCVFLVSSKSQLSRATSTGNLG